MLAVGLNSIFVESAFITAYYMKIAQAIVAEYANVSIDSIVEGTSNL